MLLSSARPKEALADADKALALWNVAFEAMAVHAAANILADRKPDDWFAKIHAVNPNDGKKYALVG